MENDFDLIKQLQDVPFPPTSLIQSIFALDTIDSTNSYAKQYIRDSINSDQTLIIADQQTTGRGRFDRKWISPPGGGLWFSVILRPLINTREWFCYSLIAAITVARTIESVTGLRVQLKWPNDALIQGKKCCGILIESVHHADRPYLIIGIGLNVNQRDFPDELQTTATSLFIETQQRWCRKDILIKWVDYFSSYHSFNAQSIIEEWKSLSDMFGQTVIIHTNDEQYEATATDMADDGGLVISRNGSRIRIYAGDVRIKIKK